MSFEITLGATPRNSGGFEILEPGWYTFAIRACYDTDKEGEPLIARTGTPYLKMLCEDIQSGTTIPHVVFLDAEKTQRLMYLLKATGNEFEDGETVTITTHMFEGKSFRGKVDVEEGRNRIMMTNPIPDKQVEEEFTPPPAEDPKPIDPELEEDVPF
jgi:hypothetical protein